ncbi:hypothetical protein N656DRAFT_787196 [Canariomyces notabilis]|uniref:ER-bound oxygenase mpaB/mpaB'/Rubber oxygenase catalytic domain-containing protein n=1 Tax=Canariomyces notabilis TaxID=2074819 RepID=A0AAN6YVE7_9PEZI|nr:hypothetical protein N656DRAFT_787196 [Canariomyces arenarius]
MSSRRLENGTRVQAWDYEFDWTPEHLTSEQLRPMIFSYDELATRCLDRLDDLSPLHLRSKTQSKSKVAASNDTAPGKQHPDLYEVLRERAPDDETLRQLWDQVTTVPDWVDWAQLERGQKVFYRYAGPSIVGLTFQSLLGGLGSARVVETLARTGGFGVSVVRRRLLSTFQHLLDVTHDIDSIKPGSSGRGFASSIRVRLLHASVRRRILALARSRPDYFDLSQHGVPINDLDSLGTVLTFSATLIWIALPRQGIRLRLDEVTDYLALWRYLAYILGAPSSHLCTPSQARAMMESLLLSELAHPGPSTTSRTLARNMLTALAGQPPGYLSPSLLHAEAHWLNGHALADALGVPRPAWHHTVLVAVQCAYFAVVCRARRSVRAWDEASIRRLRRLLEGIVLKEIGGERATHTFHYVPRLGKGTTGGTSGEGRRDVVTAQRSLWFW